MGKPFLRLLSLIGALWLIGAPTAWLWAQACFCGVQTEARCCQSTQEGHCGCTLDNAAHDPSDIALAERIKVGEGVWLLGLAPSFELEQPIPTFGVFPRPLLQNHSPPLQPQAPRAPPLC